MAIKPDNKYQRLAALDFQVNRIDLVVIDLTHAPKILHLASAAINSSAESHIISEQIAHWAQEYKLQDWTWVISLNRPDYQIQMMEAPDLSDDEIHQALQLKVQDFVSEPIEELVIDTILLPHEAFSGRRRMAFAVIAKRARLVAIHEMMLYLGLKLHSIDVYEQSIRNIIALCTQAERSGLVLMGGDGSTMLMTFEQQLCLQRQLEMGCNSFRSDRMNDPDGLLQSPLRLQMDAMALEIQRSFDYYESQLNLGAVSELKLLRTQPVPDELVDVLKTTFGAKVSWLQLAEHIELAESIELNLNDYIAAIGAGLRYYEVEV